MSTETTMMMPDVRLCAWSIRTESIAVEYEAGMYEVRHHHPNPRHASNTPSNAPPTRAGTHRNVGRGERDYAIPKHEGRKPRSQRAEPPHRAHHAVMVCRVHCTPSTSRYDREVAGAGTVKISRPPFRCPAFSRDIDARSPPSVMHCDVTGFHWHPQPLTSRADPWLQ